MNYVFYVLDENVLLSVTHSDHNDTVIHNDGCNTKKRYGKLISQETNYANQVEN